MREPTPISILDLAAVGREETVAESFASSATAVGTAGEVATYLQSFAADTNADELIAAHYSDSVPNRLRSVELTA